MFRRDLQYPRLLFVPLLLMIRCAPVTAADDTGAEVSRHFLAGRQAQSSGNFELAVQEYRAVLQLEPDLAEARLNLGLVFFLQNRYDESARAFEKSLSTKPGLRGANLFLGMDYVKLGLPRRAVPCLKLAVSEEPRNKEAHTWLATALWDSGQQTEAFAELRSAAQAFPSDPDVLFLLGEAYRNAASDEIKRVLAAVGTPLYHQVFGDIYTEQRAWAQAQWHYRRALEKDPHRADAHLGLGETYWQQGEWDQARSEFLSAAADHADAANAKLADPATIYQRARNEFDQHDFDSARSHLIAFLAVHQEHAEARYLLARTYRALSLSVLAEMLSAAPDAPRTHQLLGRTLAEGEENEKALTEYRQVEAEEPTVAGLHFAIGEVLWKLKQTDPAMLEFKQELRLNPGHAEASAAAGTILVSEHLPDQAVPYLEKALQLKPGLLLAHQELGKALYQRGDFRKAELELRKALADDPQGNLHYQLGQVYKELGRGREANAAFTESRRIKAERLNAANLEKSPEDKP